MHTIWKYEVPLDKELATIKIVGFVKILSFVVQSDKLFVYVIVNKEDTCVYRLTVYIKGTGWDLPNRIWNVDYIFFAGSFVIPSAVGGLFVWHIWYERSPIVHPDDNYEKRNKRR